MALKTRFERIARGAGARALGFQRVADEAVRFLVVHPDQIERDPAQPRRDLGSLEGLKASIAAQGILQPLIVSPLPENRYRLIAGERRWTAARAAGVSEAPVIVRSVADHERLTLQIVENLHRKDLGPLEEAHSYRRLMEEFSLGQRDIAAKLGKSLAQVNETLRILDLPESILKDIRTSEHEVSKSILLEIAKQGDPKSQSRLWELARAGRLTVKEAREYKESARQTNRVTNRLPAGGAASQPAQGREEAAAWRAEIGAARVSVEFPAKRGLVSTAAVRKALESALRQLADEPERG